MHYSYEEAIDKVLEIRNRIGGSMPLKEDYDKMEAVADVDDLADALGVRKTMAITHARAYAAVNIAVVRELRHREGVRTVRVADPLSVNLNHLAEQKATPEGAARVKEINKNRAKIIEESLWTKRKVAEAVLRFYDLYGQVPTYEDTCRGGLFAEMDGPTPSNRTLYQYLGISRSGWIEKCKKILK